MIVVFRDVGVTEMEYLLDIDKSQVGVIVDERNTWYILCMFHDLGLNTLHTDKNTQTLGSHLGGNVVRRNNFMVNKTLD